MSSSSASNSIQVAGATGFRLPTSAEWQYCARYIGHTAPTTGTLKTEYIAQGENGDYYSLTAGYFWTPGNYLSGGLYSDPINSGACGNFNNSSTASVGSCIYSNKLSIQDMGGNVQEMCFDNLSTNPGKKAAWGGYYLLTDMSGCTVSSEGEAGKNIYTGFRVVRSISSN